MKTTFLICVLCVTMEVLIVQCQLSKTLGNRFKPQSKLSNPPQNQFSSKKLRNNLIPNNEKSKLNQEMDNLSARIYPSNLKKSGNIGNWNKPHFKLTNPPQNQFSNKRPRNNFISNNEKSKLNQQMDKLSARLNPSNLRRSENIGNMQLDRKRSSMFGVSSDNGKPKNSNLGYSHEFSNGARIHSGVALNQENFLGRPNPDNEHLIQQQQQQEIDEDEFDNDIAMSDEEDETFY
jgi:hypothetical protein